MVNKLCGELKGQLLLNPQCEPSKENVAMTHPNKRFFWSKYAGNLLHFALFLDIVATIALLPTAVLRSQVLSFSASTVLLSQFFFFFSQLWSTVAVERFAWRFGAFTSLAISSFVTTLIIILGTIALHQNLPYLYLLTRLLSGLFRHPTVLSGFCVYELPGVSKEYEISAVAIPSHIFALFFGGILGDYRPEITFITLVLALIEFFVAVIFTLLSVTCARTQKTVPPLQTVKVYKEWLQQQHYGVVAVSIPSSFVVFCASTIQYMYPFIDRTVFGLGYRVIGLHLAVVFGIQHIVAQAVVRRFGTGRLLLYTCTVVFMLGMYVNLWVPENGPFYYFVLTLLFVDLPAAVLEFLLDTMAERSFSLASVTLAKKLHRHVKLATKQWTSTFFLLAYVILDGREDVTRILALPVAVGLAVFILTHRLSVAFAAIFGVFGAFLGGFSATL